MYDNRIICLGVSGLQNTFLFSRNSHKPENAFRLDKSSDGMKFEKVADFSLRASNRKGLIYQDFRLSSFKGKYILSSRVIEKGIGSVEIYESDDLSSWDKLSSLDSVHDSSIVITDYKHDDRYVMYVGGKSIKVLETSNFVTWAGHRIAVEIPQVDMKHHCIVASTTLLEEGILLTYFLSNNPHNTTSYSIKAMLFDIDDPAKPIWDAPRTIMNQEGHKLPIGVAVDNHIVSYWQRWDGDLIAIDHGDLTHFLSGTQTSKHPKLERHHKNPLLTPRSDHDWQSVAVFNPAAIYDDGKIHLIYRAVGESNISMWGHAVSQDGVNYKVDDKPIYMQNIFFNHEFSGLPSKYVSGPGWGGCEDPRAVVIDDKLYVIYVAFDGYNPQRVTLTSMEMKDFRTGDWKWSTPTALSPYGRSSKNWVLFPKKINGKFALIHSITPNISIEYIDDLRNVRLIDSYFAQTNRYDHWDNWVRGVGPPPLETPEGWLLFYHAMDRNDPGKYKLGVMLLDLDDPTRILYRSKSPILEPQTSYENDGLKPGVIFATGALLIDDNINVYYGGSDNTINTAYFSLNEFLKDLKNHNAIKPYKLEIGGYNI